MLPFVGLVTWNVSLLQCNIIGDERLWQDKSGGQEFSRTRWRGKGRCDLASTLVCGMAAKPERNSQGETDKFCAHEVYSSV